MVSNVDDGLHSESVPGWVSRSWCGGAALGMVMVGWFFVEVALPAHGEVKWSVLFEHNGRNIIIYEFLYILYPADNTALINMLC